MRLHAISGAYSGPLFLWLYRARARANLRLRRSHLS